MIGSVIVVKEALAKEPIVPELVVKPSTIIRKFQIFFRQSLKKNLSKTYCGWKDTFTFFTLLSIIIYILFINNL